MAKPYDRAFKALAETDPRGLLHLFGALPLDVEAEVEVIERELVMPSLQVDQIYRVRTREREWRAHFEAQTRWEPGMRARVAEYMLALWLRHKVDVETVVVLLTKHGVPEPALGPYAITAGHIRLEVDFRVIRVWEMDPEPVLQSQRPQLLPWVPLMNASRAEVVEAARRIAAAGNREGVGEFLMLGGLRYDRSVLAAMLRRGANVLLREEILQQSSYYQWILAKGKARGEAKGLEKGREEGREEGLRHGHELGRMEEGRRILARLLAARFPTLKAARAVDAITSIKQMEAAIDRVLAAKTADQARAALAVRRATR